MVPPSRYWLFGSVTGTYLVNLLKGSVPLTRDSTGSYKRHEPETGGILTVGLEAAQWVYSCIVSFALGYYYHIYRMVKK